MFVLDTNTLVYFFRGEGNVVERLLRTPPSEIAVPTIVVFEIEAGLARLTSPARRRAQLDALLAVVRILPFGLAEARQAAKVRAQLEAAGTPIGPMDTLIAGVALAAKAVLVTRNVREFGRVKGLVLENWYGGRA